MENWIFFSSGGLYGLSEPLLQYHGNHNGGHGFGAGANMEPPYKRKYEDWWSACLAIK